MKLVGVFLSTISSTHTGERKNAWEGAIVVVLFPLTRKCLLYEQLQVQEYWVVNVETSEILAFAVADGGSRRISESQVLAGLEIGVVEEALKRSQTEDDGAITRWLISSWSGLGDGTTR